VCVCVYICSERERERKGDALQKQENVRPTTLSSLRFSLLVKTFLFMIPFEVLSLFTFVSSSESNPMERAHACNND